MAALLTPPPTGELVKVRLGQLIAERRYNFRQEGVNPERVDMYYRRLRNGETPPPIEVDRPTKTIIDGMHRYHVWKRWAEETLGRQGKNWRDFEIEVLMTDGAPDRDKEPLAFLVETVKRNRAHGEPPKRADIIWLLKRVIRTYKDQKETARRIAVDMNETNESFEAEWRKIHGRPEVKPITGAEGKPKTPPPNPPESITKPAPAEIVRQSPPPATTAPEAPKVEETTKVTETVKEAQKPPQEPPVAVAEQAKTPKQEPPKRATQTPAHRYPYMASYAEQLRKWIEGSTDYTPEQVKALNLLRATINSKVPQW